MATEADILKDALECFEASADAETENRETWLADTRFARLADQYQWPANIRKKREAEDRPCLTINRLAGFGRRVVNEIRQNKISIKVSPVDSHADPVTASIMTGLIRNIETVSKASHAYEAGAEDSVYGGWGYWRVDYDYSHDDTFDKEITIDRIPDPLCVYGDPWSKRADSADWMTAFITDMMKKEEYEKAYPGHPVSDFKGSDTQKQHWLTQDGVQVAEWFKRDEVDRLILMLSNGVVVGGDSYRENKAYWDGESVTVKQERTVKSYKVTHYLLNGTGIIETTDWPGRFIPVIPVYGEEKRIEGKRFFHSLIHDALDSQRSHNYWRSTAVELGALAPKAPWIIHEDGLPEDEDEAKKWDNANTENYSYLLYSGNVPPQRQPFAGVPTGALQEAVNASDDMKAIMGIYDASLGNRSNETSGRAINARKVEGETATFNFVDNLARAISHTGTVLVDLIPSVYSGERIIRVMGEDESVQNVRLGKQDTTPNAQTQAQQGEQETGSAKFDGVYDLSAGRYDVTVKVGPSFATQREEAADQMTAFIQAYPAAAQFVGDLWAKNLDWPGADEIAKRLKMMLPANMNDGIPPELMKMIQEGKQMIAALQAENQQLKADQSIEQEKLGVEREKIANDRRKTGNERIKAISEARKTHAEAANMQAQAQQTMTGNEAIAQIGMVAQALAQAAAQMQQTAAIMGEAMTKQMLPKKKVARAQKQADGSFVMESVEG